MYSFWSIVRLNEHHANKHTQKHNAELFQNAIENVLGERGRDECVHHMHICTQINDENNDLIKVFMTFRFR